MRLVLAGRRHQRRAHGVTSARACSATASPSGFRAWSVGSLEGVTADAVWQVLPFFLVGFVLALALGPALNAIALGDQLASALGAGDRIRVVGILATTLLCGAATAVAGPVAFIGLLVPHAVRPFTGPDNRWLLPFSMVAGAILRARLRRRGPAAAVALGARGVRGDRGDRRPRLHPHRASPPAGPAVSTLSVPACP